MAFEALPPNRPLHKKGDAFTEFEATTIGNLPNTFPGADYSHRTFREGKPSTNCAVAGGQKYYVLLNNSSLPEGLGKDVKIIHVGSMSPEDQVAAIKRIPKNQFACSVNGLACSGIRVFNGQVVKDEKT